MEKKIYFLFLLLLFVQYGYSQVFSIRPGKVWYNSKTITPVIGQFEEGDLDDYFSFHFDYYAKNKKVQLGLAYAFYRGTTGFKLKTDFWRGNATAATTVHRYELKGGYNLLKSSSGLKLMPQLRIIFENAVATASFSERAYIDSRIDDNYEGPIFVDPFDSFQILPGLGIDLDWNYWWRLHFVLNVYHAWGHKPFQKYYFEYTYDGVEQPRGEWYSDGTGWFLSAGMGMTLFGYQKEKAARALRGKGKKSKNRKRRRRL